MQPKGRLPEAKEADFDGEKISCEKNVIES
jgi:hypothetical protein